MVGVTIDATPVKRKVAVLGAGSWGTTFAKMLADGGSDVAIWARRPELAREITQSKRNSDYLPGINLPRGLWSSSRLPEALDGAEQVYLSVPSQSLRENLIDRPRPDPEERDRRLAHEGRRAAAPASG